MKKINVNLKERSYPIYVGAGTIRETGRIASGFSAHKTVIVTNPLVYSLAGKALEDALKSAGLKFFTAVVPDGEKYKTLHTAKRLYDELIKYDAGRDTLIIALGGGVIGDLAGFVASTFMRGIPFIQVPTTLLAQVDASIGGKVGVDHPAGKNLIGSFYQPKAVIIDCELLGSLKEREFKNGMAEVIKTAAILDADLFKIIEKNFGAILLRDRDILLKVVERTCSHKARVVETDEREGGLRAILNYGHTFAHAFEFLTGFKGLKHGEAVMAGMILASRLAFSSGVCNPETAERQETLIRRMSLNKMVFSFIPNDVIAAMGTDKKKKSGKLRFILTDMIGHAFVHEDIAKSQLLGLLKNFRG